MTSKRNRNLLIIIGLLLIINIGLLLYMFVWSGTRKPRSNNGRNEKELFNIALQKEVGFSRDQVELYKKTRADQGKLSKPFFERLQKSRDSLFSLVKNDEISDSTIDMIATRVADNQKELDLKAFYNFKKLRAICLPEQTTRYDSLIKKTYGRKGKPGK